MDYLKKVHLVTGVDGAHVAVFELDVRIVIKDALQQAVVIAARVHRM